MQNESSIKQIIDSSLDQIRTIVDANTVVGNQIQTSSGTVIIPISKVSMGFASGGLDLPAKSEEGNKNFGGGGGTGVTVLPIGFLTVYPDGKVEMLPISPEKSSPIEQVADIIDQAPDILARIKAVFKGEAGDAEDTPDAEQICRMEAECAKQLADEPAEPLTRKEIKMMKKAAAKEAKEAKKLAKKG